MNFNNINILENITSHTTDVSSLEALIEQIRNGKYQSIIKEIRSAEPEQRKAIKRSRLPAFFPSIRLGNGRVLSQDDHPTGIVQFDLDLDKNPGISITTLKNALLEMKELIYCFTSPSGGLKFGVMTDFHRHDNESNQALRERFVLAYQAVEERILAPLVHTITLDHSMTSIVANCFLSHDPDAFYNDKAAMMSVDEGLNLTPPASSVSHPSSVSRDWILEVLAHIPKTLGYAERFPINTTILYYLGRDEGIPALFNHWSKPERDELGAQLKEHYRVVSTSRHSFRYNVGTLTNAAQRHGWSPVTGAARKKISAHSTDEGLQPLLDREEAMQQLQHHVSEFFQDRKSKFINVSVGAGKTQRVLEMLRELPPQIKVLFLVKTHTLAEQIYKDFHSIPLAPKAGLSKFRNQLRPRSRCDVKKGKFKACENLPIRDAYAKSGISIPNALCEKDCLYDMQCGYMLQFDPVANIRIMSHEEFFNDEAKYSSGNVTGDSQTHKWVPDFIIVDEDVVQWEEHTETTQCAFRSINNVICTKMLGTPLPEAVLAYSDAVMQDGLLNVAPQPIAYTNPKQFLQDSIKARQQKQGFSTILSSLCQFIISRDHDHLHGMRVEDRGGIPTLVQSRVKKINARHQTVPILYLDATADLRLMENILPGVEMISLKVKSSPDINIYQLVNKPLSKRSLETQELLDRVVHGLKVLVSNYKKPALITYKNIPGRTDFYAYMAEAIGVEPEWTGYFGNLRGLNHFEEADCLIVLGRQFIGINEASSFAYAVYGSLENSNAVYADRLVRMKDGSATRLNTQIQCDDQFGSIINHTSVSETIQAIGRGRIIHGKPKDIYYLSNAYIGTDIEITDFIDFEQQFPKILVSEDAMNKAMAIGFVQDKPKALKEILNVSVHQIKTHKQMISNELEEKGFMLKTM